MPETIEQKTEYVAPGPGPWFLETTHYPRPLTLYYTQTYSEPYADAWRSTFSRYGSLLDRIECRFSGSFAYIQICPLLPPNPELQQRIETCTTMLASKLWQKDIKRWDEVDKPATIRAHLALIRTDLEALDTEALVAYLESCRQNFLKMIYQHHFYNMATMVPVGDYLMHAADFSGLPAGQLLQLLQGASPVSAGASAELLALAELLRGEPAAQTIVHADLPASEILARLRGLSGEVGAAVQGHLDMVGYRPISGYDIADPYTLEMPELLVEGIRQILGSTQKDDQALLAQQTAAVRDAVADQHRAQFDELLGEARLVYRLRDERDLFSDTWAAGITRRALQVAGQRAAKAGHLVAAADILDASVEEIPGIVRGTGQRPDPLALHQRAERRRSLRITDAPPMFGEPPPPPPPLDWLPKDAQRVARAIDGVLGAILATPKARTERRRVCGLGASSGIYEGIARHASSTEELGKIQKGDVLVSEATSASFNVVLPLLGAIVTNRGGVLSHAAIIAREFGIPAVVGTTDATREIPDGARVRVNADTGEVEVLD